MDALYTYLLVGSAAGCALGGVVGWWMRKQGEAARQHDVEVYYREALKISESARDRAREEAEQLGVRTRAFRERNEARETELEELRSYLEGVKQAGNDTTERIEELEAEVRRLRGRLKERESVVSRLQKEWKKREAKLLADNNGHGEVGRLQAELRAMTEARATSGAEADLLRERVRELEAGAVEPAHANRDGNGARGMGVAGSGSRPMEGNGNGARVVRGAGNPTRPAASNGNGAPRWLLPAANGDQDDLKSIHGLGPVLEAGLNKLGVYYFRQVAKMTKEDVEWLAPRLNIHAGRILRGEWAQQARECHRRKYKETL